MVYWECGGWEGWCTGCAVGGEDGVLGVQWVGRMVYWVCGGWGGWHNGCAVGGEDGVLGVQWVRRMVYWACGGWGGWRTGCAMGGRRSLKELYYKHGNSVSSSGLNACEMNRSLVQLRTTTALVKEPLHHHFDNHRPDCQTARLPESISCPLGMEHHQ